MVDKTPHRSIEKRILSSILLVGIAPLALAFVLGVVMVHAWQRQAALTSLQTTVERVENSFRSALDIHLDHAKYMAESEEVRNAFAAEVFSETFIESSIKMPTETHSLVLWDMEGNILAHHGSQEVNSFTDCLQQDVPLTPSLARLLCWSEKDLFLAQFTVPVMGSDGEKPVGYLAWTVDVTQLVLTTLDGYLSRVRSLVTPESVQLVYRDAESVYVVGMSENRRMYRETVDDRILAWVGEESVPPSDPVSLDRYPTARGPAKTYIAARTLYSSPCVLLLVYRTRSSVFLPVALWALAGFGFCFCALAILCLNAYQNVHNKIVRNVLLVNEGAQIIEKGDLNLKLKINTGDEIEELATSFNRMAQALRRNMQRLAESEEKHRNLVDSMRDGIVQTGPGAVITLINPVGAEILGFTDTCEVIGRKVVDLFPNPFELWGFYRELILNRFSDRSRLWITRKDNKRLCLEISANLTRDEQGHVIGVEGIFRDVTRNVELETESRERAERLAAINQIATAINSSLEAGSLYESLVVELQKLVRFDTASVSLLNEFGDALTMRRLWPTLDEEPCATCSITDTAWCGAIVLRSQESLLIADMDAPSLRHYNDFPEDIHSCLSIPLFARGRVVGALNLGSRHADAFTLHDADVIQQMAPHVAVALRNVQLLENLKTSLDEVTHAREKLFEANEELKTLDEMKTNLLSNVSHELRTPLVSVMGYTDMIVNGKAGPINEQQKEYLNISLRNIEKLVTLIENLLDFSKLHRGAETIIFDTLNLTECARSSIAIVRPVADNREIQLDIIAPDEPVLVDGDKGKLGQLFNNLLSNAVKFNTNGGWVTIEIRPMGNSVEVSVSDTGIGFPKEAIDKIFTRFYQYDASSTRRYGGTGIGLSIAQDIARLHGANITATSEVGKGSRFSFILPLRKKKEITAEGTVVPVQETRGLLEVITCDRAFCSQIRTMMSTEGIDVVVAGTRKKALDISAQHRPDCIIIDMDSDKGAIRILDDILDEHAGTGQPVVVYTDNDEIYQKYRSVLASRLRPGFRKSSLLSAVRYAMKGGATEKLPAGRQILCVDDETDVINLIRHCLEPEGYSVDYAASGEEALERLAQGDYGLVLLDVAMPSMDGWEVCRRIKNDPQLTNIHVHMLTAKPLSSIEADYHKSRADGLLLKPFRPEDLLQLLASIDMIRPDNEATS